jgi:GWxTD domain-containing protein
MKEFYTRADYAMINYSFNGQRNGAFSDRGKIYIQFGKPDKIEREYNSKNENTEIWYYASVKREFIFEDTSGKGNYLLRK